MAEEVFTQAPETLIKKHTVAAPAVAEPTAEETTAREASLSELRTKLPSVLFGDKPRDLAAEAAAKAVKDKAAADAAAVKANAGKTVEQLAAEKLAADKAAEEAAKPKVKVSKQQTAQEIARDAATEFAKTLAEARPAAPIAQAAAPASEAPKEGAPAHFSRADKENYDLFKVLSDSEPERYKDKHLEFAQFVDKLSTYKSKWQKANPRGTFDPAADDHEEFYTANQPQYDDGDLSKARIRLETSREVDKRLSAQRKEYETKLADIERKTVGAEVGREAAHAANQATTSFINQLPDAAVKEIALKGPEALKESDPLAFEVLNRSAADLQQAVVELHSIVNRPGHYNPQNPMHTYISGFVVQQENQIKALPATQQLYDGKRFATRSEYSAMPAAQRSQYWVLTEPDVVHMLTASTAASASQTLKNERARVESMAVKYGFTKTAASPATQAAAAAVAAAAKPAVVKPTSPTSTAGDAALPAGAGAPVNMKSDEKKVVGMLW